MKINEKIYSLRKENNLSQEELAGKLNVSRQTISKWELGESTPDFDKIVPLCEVFGISTEELLRDRKIEEKMVVESNSDDKESVDVVKAVLICIAIFLYFFAIASIIIGEVALQLNDGLVVSIFLIICGIATALIVFTCMTRPSKKDNDNEEVKDPVLKSALEIASLVALCIYLLLSFTTMAWHLTWIIWIIYAIVAQIIKLVFLLKGVKVDEE